MTTEQQPNAQHPDDIWLSQQLQKATKFLADQGIIADNILLSQSRYMAPHAAVWLVEAANGSNYWVITGDLPTDAVVSSAAKTAREAMRSFHLRWQLRAEQLLRVPASDEMKSTASTLVVAAETLFTLVENSQMWQQDLS